ncbi:MAG: tetratricopeptide repeat protein, partial [Planctomycetota bacterium]
ILIYAFAVSYIHLKDKPTKARILGFAIWAGALTFTVQSTFGKAPMGWSFSTNYWILLGVLASAAHWTGETARAEEDDKPLRIGPAGWVALGVAAFLVGWCWWTWAVGAYASKVHMNRARTARLAMSKPGQQWQFEKFKTQLAEGRPRCLWPDDVLHDEYVIGWFLTDHRRWAAAAEQLERVQQIAPDFLETRLFLARCYLNMGKRREAMEHLAGYLRVDPYNPKAYRLLSYIDPVSASAALEQEVLSRLVQPDDWIVEDPPTSGQVRQLLDFYIRGGQLQKARDTVTRVEDFMATAHVSRSCRFNVRQLPQELRQKYERGDEKQLLRQVDAAFPGLGQRGASSRRQSP